MSSGLGKNGGKFEAGEIDALRTIKGINSDQYADGDN
jgi:hypothetical protein